MSNDEFSNSSNENGKPNGHCPCLDGKNDWRRRDKRRGENGICSKISKIGLSEKACAPYRCRRSNKFPPPGERLLLFHVLLRVQQLWLLYMFSSVTINLKRYIWHTNSSYDDAFGRTLFVDADASCAILYVYGISFALYNSVSGANTYLHANMWRVWQLCQLPIIIRLDFLINEKFSNQKCQLKWN